MGDRWPNNYTGDLVPDGCGRWMVVAPLYCPNWHPYQPGRYSVGTPICECGTRHYAWTCWCDATFYAPKLGPHCRIRAGFESAAEEYRRHR